MTRDTWHITLDTWHVTPDMWTMMNALKKYIKKKAASVRFGIGATIRTCQEIQCLPYAGYFFVNHLYFTLGDSHVCLIVNHLVKWIIVVRNTQHPLLTCTSPGGDSFHSRDGSPWRWTPFLSWGFLSDVPQSQRVNPPSAHLPTQESSYPYCQHTEDEGAVRKLGPCHWGGGCCRQLNIKA